MLAPFPADEQGREVPHERMVPYLIEQSVEIAVGPIRPPAIARSRPLSDLRNEPVLALGRSGAAGIGAPWPPERAWTLRPPTRDELVVTPLGALSAASSWAAWQPAIAWLRSEAMRPRPGVQRYADAVLIVAFADAPAADARAAATMLTRFGAADRARVAVVGADGRWAARDLRPATLPVAAIEEHAGDAARERPAPPPRSVEGDPLAAVLAQPILGPRCHEVIARSAAELELPAAAPEDSIAVRGFEPTLAEFLAAEARTAGPRLLLGDRCE